MPSAGRPYPHAVEMGCARTILVLVLMDGRGRSVSIAEEKSGESLKLHKGFDLKTTR